MIAIEQAQYSHGATGPGHPGQDDWKLQNGRYGGQAISMYTTRSEQRPPQGSFELDAIHMRNEFVGCNTLKSTIDFFGAYFDLSRRPFVDPPDLSYLPPDGKIVETYHRMPTGCPACGLLGVPSASVRRSR